LTSDVTAGGCITCIPSAVASTTTPVLCLEILDPNNYLGFGCNSDVCKVATATYTAAVTGPPAVAYHLTIATCGKGYVKDVANNYCILNKSDWPTSVTDIDTQSGKIKSCASGYALVSNRCVPSISNC